MEAFEVIGAKYDEEVEMMFYNFKFNLGNATYYSGYKVSHEFLKIYLAFHYYTDGEFNAEPISFSKELYIEIQMLILKQKDIRLRHLFNPYTLI